MEGMAGTFTAERLHQPRELVPCASCNQVTGTTDHLCAYRYRGTGDHQPAPAHEHNIAAHSLWQRIASLHTDR